MTVEKWDHNNKEGPINTNKEFKRQESRLRQTKFRFGQRTCVFRGKTLITEKQPPQERHVRVVDIATEIIRYLRGPQVHQFSNYVLPSINKI